MLESLFQLLVLAIPVACVSWTVTHEEIFREVREWFHRKSRSGPRLTHQKFFYVFTCEYCFSHYVALAATALADFRLVLPGWRGFIVAWLSLVWIANVYMSVFARLRLDIKAEKLEIEEEESARRVDSAPDEVSRERDDHRWSRHRSTRR